MTNFKYSFFITFLSAATSWSAQPPVGNQTGTQVPAPTQSLNSQIAPADQSQATPNINNTVGATSATTTVAPANSVPSVLATAPGTSSVSTSTITNATAIAPPSGETAVTSGTGVMAPPPGTSTGGDSNDSTSANDTYYSDSLSASTVPIQSAADAELSARVQRELERKFPSYEQFGHSIYSQDGVVTLQGPVQTQSDYNNMEKTVKRLKGVKSVRNYMSVEESGRTR